MNKVVTELSRQCGYTNCVEWDNCRYVFFDENIL